MITILTFWISITIYFKPFKTKIANTLNIFTDMLLISLLVIFIIIHRKEKLIRSNPENYLLNKFFYEQTIVLGWIGVVIVSIILLLHLICGILNYIIILY